jgi:hypothetical protein
MEPPGGVQGPRSSNNEEAVIGSSAFGTRSYAPRDLGNEPRLPRPIACDHRDAHQD